MNMGNPSFLWDFFKLKQVSYNLRVKDGVRLTDTRTFDMTTTPYHSEGVRSGTGFQMPFKKMPITIEFKRMMTV